MASNECTQDAVAAIGHNATVLWMSRVSRFRIRGHSEADATTSKMEYGIPKKQAYSPIVKVYAIIMVLNSFKVFGAAHLAKIP